MANQYSNASFKVVVEAKYNMPVGEVLRRFQRYGMSLKEIAEKTGFRETTVKKYALRYNSILTNSYNPKANRDELELKALYTELRSDRLNRINVLSISWTGKKRA